MEEILASIRRIIADDTGGAARPTPRVVPEAPADAADSGMVSRPSAPLDPVMPEPDILELTQPVEQNSAAFTAVRGPDVVFREEEQRPAAVAPSPPPPAAAAPPPLARPAPAPARAEDTLLSDNSSFAVTAAFNSLARTVLSENSRTLEDIVREMMRPMLKHWLDENLPGLVERIVRAEIERVSRGGR